MQVQPQDALPKIMLARYYSSSLARFLSRDPAPGSLRFPVPQGWNAYAYSLNNPLLYVDPLGRDVVLANMKPKHERQIVDGVARALRNSSFNSNVTNAETSELVVTVKVGKTKDTPKPDGTWEINPGHLEPVENEKGELVGFDVTIDLGDINFAEDTGQSENMLVQTLAEEFQHVNNQLTQEGRDQVNADPDAEEEQAEQAGEDTAADEATKDKATDKEKEETRELLTRKK